MRNFSHGKSWDYVLKTFKSRNDFRSITRHCVSHGPHSRDALNIALGHRQRCLQPEHGLRSPDGPLSAIGAQPPHLQGIWKIGLGSPQQHNSWEADLWAGKPPTTQWLGSCWCKNILLVEASQSSGEFFLQLAYIYIYIYIYIHIDAYIEAEPIWLWPCMIEKIIVYGPSSELGSPPRQKQGRSLLHSLPAIRSSEAGLAARPWCSHSLEPLRTFFEGQWNC